MRSTRCLRNAFIFAALVRIQFAGPLWADATSPNTPTSPATVTCPSNLILNAASGSCGAIANYTIPIPTIGTCGIATVVCVPPPGTFCGVGITPVTCTATDLCGKTTCGFTITVKDVFPPVVVCPPNQTANANAGQCAAVVSYPAPSVSDNCQKTTVSCSPPSGSSFPVGVTPVTCTARDSSGNTASCSFTVTVKDNQPPQLVCPPNQNVNCAPAQCAAVVSYPAPTVSDNCPGATTVVCVPPSGSAFPVGTTTVICIATDASLNKDTCSFTVTVRDNLPPLVVCPPDLTLPAGKDSCGTSANYSIPVATDNCPGVTVTCVPPPGSFCGIGTKPVVCIAKDLAGNADTCSFTVTVKDLLPPVVVCPPNQTANANPGQCAAVVTYPAPTVIENCPPATVSCTPPSGSTFPVGNSTVVCIAADASGNKDTCSFTVTVRDNQPPVVNCPPNQETNARPGECAAVVTYPPATVSDNCPGATVSCTPSSGSTFPVGITIVKCTATDASGNKATCYFKVTVWDNQPPLVVCPPNQTANAGTACEATVQYPPPTVSDNCPDATVNCSPPSGSTFPVGTTTVICIAVDASENKDTCSFTVTVRDNQPPQVVCPPNQTANANPGQCAAAVSYPPATFSDNCPGGSVSCAPPSGSTFPVGNSTVVCIATDASGNKDTCSFTVTVKDNQPPTVNCPPNQTANAGSNCVAVVTYPPATFSDNCPGGSVSCAPPSGSTFPVGNSTVICIAVDASLNKDTCSFTVTVRDIQPPTVVCPPNITLAAIKDSCGAILTYTIPGAIDNCPGTTVVTCVPPPGSFCGIGTKPVVCIAKDLAGNADTCSFTVTVKDLLPPVVVCPPNQTANANPGQCAAVVTYPAPTVIENCPPATVSCTPPSGSTFPVGNSTVICIAVDAAGNKDTCSFTVTVRDNQPPVVNCPPNQNVNCAPAQCAAVVSYPAPTVSDNCPGATTVVCVPPSGSAFPVGTTTVICIATDASLNKDTCSFTVTVRDNLPPLVVCPPDLTLPAGKDSCGTSANYSIPVATDNCPGVTVTCVPPPGSFCGIGTKPVVCIAKDLAGNADTCSFTVTVKDLLPPVVVCPPNQTANANPGQCAAAVSYPPATFSDNCPGGSASCAPPSGSTFPVGNSTVICVATDASGNKDTCSFTVTVKDNQPPTVNCPPNQTANAGSNCVAVVTYPPATFSDNCPGGSVRCSPPSGSTFPVGNSTVICIAVDASLNKDTCSFTVTVRDIQPPLVSCPPNLTLAAIKDSCGAILTYTIPGAIDNCPGTTVVTCVPPPGSFCGIGTKPVICIAKDLAGNADTCSFTVTVKDLLPPIIVCPPNQVANAGSNCAAVVTYPAPTVIENCPPATVSCTPPSGSTFPVGNSTVVCIATDASGNKDTCSFTVTVKDNQPPVVNCPPNQETNAGSACGAVVTYPPATASDNCPDVTVSCTPSSGSTFPVGTTTVVCIAVDASGNKDTCSFTVTVRDNQPPQVVCPPNLILPAIKDSCGAIAIYTPPVATDNCPATVVVNCIPPPGSFCGIGITTVKCIAKDKSGNADTCSFTITVQDLLPPVVVCPSGITLQAGPDSCGAIAIYTPPVAIDNCGPSTVECTPPSGSFCGVGVTLVTCTATDKHGNKTTCGFSITVQDLLPPVVICPSGFTVHTKDNQGAICFYTPPVASDNCEPATVECAPASGSLCGIGITLVTCTATDRNGNQATCGFAITVILDVIAPPPPIIEAATPTAGKVNVSWTGVPDNDLKEYRVYRDTSSGFGTAAVIGHTASTQYQDSSPVLGKRLYYHLTAVDSAGNESSPSGPASALIGMKGDLNYDGRLSPTDVALLLNCVYSTEGDCPLSVADLNCDGKLSPIDAAWIYKMTYSGVPSPCP